MSYEIYYPLLKQAHSTALAHYSCKAFTFTLWLITNNKCTLYRKCNVILQTPVIIRLNNHADLNIHGNNVVDGNQL